MIQWPVKKCDFHVGQEQSPVGPPLPMCCIQILGLEQVPWVRTLINERNSKKSCGDEKENIDVKTCMALDVLFKSSITNFLMQ